MCSSDLIYTVSRRGKPVIAPSRLGFLLTDAPKIDRNLAITGQETSDFDQTWAQPWGEWASIRNHYRELKVHLRETTALARVFTVTFRIYDDGVGFRYEFPDQPNMKTTNIAEELTEFAFASDGTAWWKPAFLWNREEYLYNDVRQIEPGRYTSAYKTIIFDGQSLRSATAVHTDQIETRVLKLRCTTG